MKAANDYLNMYKRLIDDENSLYWVNAKDFKEAINKARKEAIEECAERIELFATGKLPIKTKGTFKEGIRYASIYEMYKQSILSLIKDLK